MRSNLVRAYWDVAVDEVVEVTVLVALVAVTMVVVSVALTVDDVDTDVVVVHVAVHVDDVLVPLLDDVLVADVAVTVFEVEVLLKQICVSDHCVKRT